MKTIACAVLFTGCLVLSGCASRGAASSAPNTAVDVNVPASELVEVRCKSVDNWDRAADLGAGMGRWSWSEANKGWEYLTSPETKQRVVNAYDATVSATRKGIDKAVEVYKEHSANKQGSISPGAITYQSWGTSKKVFRSPKQTSRWLREDEYEEIKDR